MKIWLTEFRAPDARTGEIKTWSGDNVDAPTWQMAQQWCYENKGWLKVIGELVMEIDAKTDDVIDYDIPQNN